MAYHGKAVRSHARNAAGVFMLALDAGHSLIDDDQIGFATSMAWYLRKGYAVGGRGRSLSLHRVVIGAKPGQWVDHINGDPLDNRVANLRFVSPAQSAWNRGPLGGNRRFKGVCLHACGKWQAAIRTNGRGTYLGLYDSEEQAARAYDRAAARMHGAFARLNFPPETA